MTILDITADGSGGVLQTDLVQRQRGGILQVTIWGRYSQDHAWAQMLTYTNTNAIELMHLPRLLFAEGTGLGDPSRAFVSVELYVNGMDR